MLVFTSMSDLLDLPRIAGDQLASVFMDRIESIFAHPRDDIAASLNKCSKESLTDVHRTLCTKATEKFDELRNRRAINRQAVGTLATDIYALGYSVVNGLLTREAEKAFHPPTTIEEQNTSQNAAQGPNADELAELLRVVAALTMRLNAVEKELEELKASSPSSSSSSSSSSTSPSIPDPNVTVPKVALATPEDSSDDEPITESNDWQTARGPRRRRRSNRSQNNMERQQQQPAEENPQNTSADIAAAPVATTTALRAANAVNDTHTVIYVGNIQTSNTADDIRKHIRDMGISGDVTINPLRKTGSQRSFKVQLPRKHKAKALSKKNWPQNVRVRPFETQRPSPRQSSSDVNFADNAREPSGRHRTPQRYAERYDEHYPERYGTVVYTTDRHDGQRYDAHRRRPTEHDRMYFDYEYEWY